MSLKDRIKEEVLLEDRLDIEDSYWVIYFKEKGVNSEGEIELRGTPRTWSGMFGPFESKSDGQKYFLLQFEKKIDKDLFSTEYWLCLNFNQLSEIQKDKAVMLFYQKG